MQSLRLQNVRSFADTQDVALRRLTILVGKNASGKSTFARWFPLLRQSILWPSASPLLWYVEGGAVDFGKMLDVVRRGEAELGFGFRLEGEDSPDVFVTLDATTPQGLIKRVRISWQRDVVDIILKGKKLDMAYVNGHEVRVGMEESTELRNLLPVVRGLFYPRSTFALYEDFCKKTYQILNVNKRISYMLYMTLEWCAPDLFKELLIRDLNKISSVKDIKISSVKYINAISTEELEPLRRDVVVWEAIKLLRRLDESLRKEASSVAYIGPFRKTPNRYERVTEIATDVVDPIGGNLAMVLRSLKEEERKALSAWLMEHLGFGITLDGDEHVRVCIIEASGRTVNIIDTGFGYSQILPVAVSLWLAKQGEKTRTLVLEQPELHLHPGLQTLLGKLLVAVAASETPADSVPLRLIVETHSEALLNAVGEAIEFGKLAREDVNVVLFERDEETGISTVKQSGFDAEGRLENWPRGFFAG